MKKRKMNRMQIAAYFLAAFLCLQTVPAARAASGYDRPEQKLAALTFDDGPGPYSDQILDVLKKHNAKATFFMNGYKAWQYADQIRRMAEEGHQIASHTVNHPYLAKSSDGKIRNEVDGNARILTEITGLSGTGDTGFFLRPPYGSFNKHVAKVANVPVIWCTLDCGDWKYKDSNRLVTYTSANLKDGDIAVMHETHKSTAQGLDRLLSALDEKGFTLVTVEDLFWRRGITPEAGVIYYSARNKGINRCERALYFDESRLETHWAWDAISYVRDKGLMEGNAYGEFLPNFPLTQRACLTVLGRLSGVTGEEPGAYLAWAKKQGLGEAAFGGAFDPDASVTRQQLAALAADYLRLRGIKTQGAVLPEYADGASIAAWAREGVAICGKRGIMQGNNGVFLPENTATRAAGAVVFRRLDGILRAEAVARAS